MEEENAGRIKMKKFTLLELVVVISIFGILMTILLPSLRKAKEASMLAVCISNHSQINTAAWAFSVQNNNHFMPAVRPDDTFGGSGTSAGLQYGWDDSLLEGYLGSIPKQDRLGRHPEYDSTFEVFKCPADYIDSNYPEGAKDFNGGKVRYRRSYSLNGVSNGANAARHSPKIFGKGESTKAADYLRPLATAQIEVPSDTIFATDNNHQYNNVGTHYRVTLGNLGNLSLVNIYDKDIDGKTYTWGVDKNTHNRGFRYPFCMIDGSVRVLNAESTRPRKNYLWLAIKPD